MEEKEMSVDEIQQQFRELAKRLEDAFRDFDFRALNRALEAQLPENLEALGDDEEQPTVAWEIHGDLGSIPDARAELMALVQRAASYTPDSVRREWADRQLGAIQDPPVRRLMALLLEGPARVSMRTPKSQK